MSIQFKRGTGTANDSYAGLDGELSIDFTNSTLRVHNGTDAGGGFSVGMATSSSTNLGATYGVENFTITSSSGTNVTIGAATASQAGAFTADEKAKLTGIQEDAEKNRDLSTKIQAETGADNATVLTPLRLFQALAAGKFTIDFGSL